MNIRLILLLFFLCGQLTAQTEKKLDFKWDTIATLNDDLGVNGAFSGIHNDAFIVAGGANFPNDPVWEGGEKVWYNTIEVLQKSNDRYNWISVNAKLPRKLAYGASVSTPDGLLCIGGNNSDGTFSEVFLLKWNPREKKIEIEKQPDLPVPLANMQATNIGDEVFVVGGQEENGSKASNKFFSFKTEKFHSLNDLEASVPAALQCPGCQGE